MVSITASADFIPALITDAEDGRLSSKRYGTAALMGTYQHQL